MCVCVGGGGGGGGLRVEEITVCNMEQNWSSTIQERWWVVCGAQKRLQIRHSKTDQVGKGSIISIPPTEYSLSLFEYDRQYLADRPNVEGPLICP